MLYSNQNTQVLVDGGGNDLLVEKIHEYIPFYDREIELLILTHSHLDHYGGLVRLLAEFKVMRVVLPPPPCQRDSFFLAFLKSIENENAQILLESEANIGKLNITFVNNQRKECIRKGENLNNSSIISIFRYEGISILNMGDYENDNNLKLNSDVNLLKAGHHCSKTSSSESFLENVSPEVAICSLGENSYGHPSAELLDRFGSLGIKYYITQEYGDIILNLSSGLIYNEAGKLITKL